MISFWSHKNTKLVLTLGLCAFLVIQLFGMSHLGMTMQPNGQMSDCPFMGKATVCNMSPLEHMATLQSMFTSTAQQSTTLTLLLLLLSAILLSFVGFSILELDTGQEDRFIRYARFRPRVFDPLRLAFARGIIHPKIF